MNDLLYISANVIKCPNMYCWFRHTITRKNRCYKKNLITININLKMYYNFVFITKNQYYKTINFQVKKN